MLAPTDRRLLLDALAPPEGYTLDQAVGTTYTLDLLALLRVPLAATALPWSRPDGAPTENPVALLTALRRNASRLSLFCHAGATKVPPRHQPLLTFLEGAVHPVKPPRPGGVFHPKLWLLRFTAEEELVRYRLLVLSRNLTFDHAWDVALSLDGKLLDRGRGMSANRPLSDFIAALPGMAAAAGQPVSTRIADRIELLVGEVRRVEWDPPDGFDAITFHPIGHDGRAGWPVEDLYRLCVISPFIGPGAIAGLRDEVRDELRVIGRFEELAKLDPDVLAAVDEVSVFDDPSGLLDVEGASEDEPEQTDPGGDLAGLHAKVFAGERYRRAVVFVGSANATDAAFDLNVEFLVELEGLRTQHGIDPLLEGLEEAGLLRPFAPGEPIEEPEELVALERRLERLAHELASGVLRATAEPAGEGRWRMEVHARRPASEGEVAIDARPLSRQTFHRLDLDGSPCARFPPTAVTSLTSFFALRLTGRAAGTERQLDVVVHLPLEGAPSGRAEAVTAELLSDRERLLRFLMLLLEDEGHTDAVLDELEQLLAEGSAGGGPPAGAAPPVGLPLLELMLRALHGAPERLDEVDRLIADLRALPGGDTALPRELDELWSTIAAVREAR